MGILTTLKKKMHSVKIPFDERYEALKEFIRHQPKKEPKRFITKTRQEYENKLKNK